MEPRSLNVDQKVNQAGIASKMGIYSGSVPATGATLTNAPSGWTNSGPSSSVYTITHSLALTANSYKVFTQVTGTSQGTAIVETRATNAFTVETSDLATPSVADRAFDFLMIVGNGE